ncbi:MAG: NTP transferase domain-containing protein [Pseudomonadota bacterium]
MKFDEIPVAEAEGAILAHGVSEGGLAFKKGRVLSAEDIKRLGQAGRASVMAARLEADDVAEDKAAAEIAAAIAGDNLVASRAFTGRCNLFAATHGLALVDAPRLDRLNGVDEAITVATLPPFALVDKRQMVATIKIIPFAAPRAALARCAAISGEGSPLVRVAPFRRARVGLVQTRLPATKPGVLEGTVATTRARVEALGSELAGELVCGHARAELAAAIAELKGRGCDPILVLGASAIVDRRDVIPAAIVAGGGEVTHFGMPVDPGNLLLVGRIGPLAVIGLPGCARSPKLNGFDWVLQRLLAGLAVSRRDIMGMGAGGLLTEIPSRPLPRKVAAPAPAAPAPAATPARAPRVAAIVLAAGRSSRMAPANKLLAELGGGRLVERALDAALGSRARPVVVVTGHEAERIRAALAARPVVIVDNPDHATGLSSSIKAGLAALGPDIDGALFVLADMPLVTAVHLDRLIAAFDPEQGRAICVPTFQGKRGNPILWAARYFPELKALMGDRGAHGLIGGHASEVARVEMADDGVLIDIDTPEALAALPADARKVTV